jgi:hypothetical protein
VEKEPYKVGVLNPQLKGSKKRRQRGRGDIQMDILPLLNLAMHC